MLLEHKKLDVAVAKIVRKLLLLLFCSYKIVWPQLSWVSLPSIRDTFLNTHTCAHIHTQNSPAHPHLLKMYTLSALFLSLAVSQTLSRAPFLTFSFPFSVLKPRVSLIRGHFISILERGQFSESNKKISWEKWHEWKKSLSIEKKENETCSQNYK